MTNDKVFACRRDCCCVCSTLQAQGKCFYFVAEIDLLHKWKSETNIIDVNGQNLYLKFKSVAATI